MLLYCVLLLFGWILYKYVIAPYVVLKKLQLKLGKKAYISFFPLLGWMYRRKQSVKMYGDELKIHKAILDKNPDVTIILTNLGIKPLIIFYDPKQYNQIYLEQEEYGKFDFIHHNQLITKGLLMQGGAKWKRQRQLLGNPFRYEKIKARIPMMNEVTRKKIENNDKKHILEFAESIAGEILMRSFFGQEAKGMQLNGTDAQLEIGRLINEVVFLRGNSLYVYIKQMLFGQKSWTLFPTKKEKELERRIYALRLASERIIQNRIMNIKIYEQVKMDVDKDFLDIYLDEYLLQEGGDNDIGFDEITQQFITFFFAGTDTMAHQSAICTYYLGLYPDMQQEMYDEVMLVIGNQENVTEHHLPKLEKLSAFIKEVLRVRSTSFSPIRVVKHTHNIQDVRVEQGWYVQQGHFIPVIQDYYVDNPNEFNYKRWLQPNPIKNDNGFVYIPFSAGPRNCIGQHMALIQMKIILCQLIRKYEIHIDPTIKHIWQQKFLYAMDPDTMIQFKARG